MEIRPSLFSASTWPDPRPRGTVVVRTESSTRRMLNPELWAHCESVQTCPAESCQWCYKHSWFIRSHY
ncbi:hypothetical protein B0H17DRAFT_304393 [Mycena rosella]|uniref:Uncharacterized protein n=1 Tax=Mycena rosella TaxID=1033263 RepID=A0AAD7CUY7_MYCRO|nr:hypothetical protein B0H17DRAFT_304393 [Mycena rosella]